MRIAPLQNGNISRDNKAFAGVMRRLGEMENHHFRRLECDGKLVTVGRPHDEWTPAEVANVAERAQSMASDPARGTKVTDAGIEEAAVAFTAENLGIFGLLSRESTGSAEFIDDAGLSWDVKSPLSPPPGQNWSYSAEHQLGVVRKDISRGDRILLNLTRVNESDQAATMSLLSAELTCDERGRLLILADA